MDIKKPTEFKSQQARLEGGIHYVDNGNREDDQSINSSTNILLYSHVLINAHIDDISKTLKSTEKICFLFYLWHMDIAQKC